MKKDISSSANFTVNTHYKNIVRRLVLENTHVIHSVLHIILEITISNRQSLRQLTSCQLVTSARKFEKLN